MSSNDWPTKIPSGKNLPGWQPPRQQEEGNRFCGYDTSDKDKNLLLLIGQFPINKPQNLMNHQTLNHNHKITTEINITKGCYTHILDLQLTPPNRSFFRSPESMAAITQAPVAVFRPHTRFLTGSPGKLNRELATRPANTYPSASFKIEAKKGEWLPGLASPGYLDGSLPGDNGFDPLGLAEDPENLRWFVQAELVNGRWAMLGVAGMLLPEVFTSIGILNVPKWYDAGKSEYFASSSTLFVIEFILFHYVEIRRWQDIKNPGSVNQDPIFKNYSLPPNECGYPGGIFNPLNFAPTAEAKEKELANGRLAMLAFLGFIVQHNVTGKGPFDNLVQHLSDPWHNTIVQTLSSGN